MHRLNRHKPIKFCSLLLLVAFILTGCSVDNSEIIAYYSYVPPIENILEGSQTKEAEESFIAIKEESTKDASIVDEQLSNNEADSEYRAEDATEESVEGDKITGMQDRNKDRHKHCHRDSHKSVEPAKIANPWTKYSFNDSEKILQKTGFEFDAPERILSYHANEFRVMNDTLIEVIYYDEKSEEGFRLRKAISDEEDISGDYREHEIFKDVTISLGSELITIHLCYDNGFVKKAYWSDSTYKYSYTASAANIGDMALASIAMSIFGK